jgi:hypothetical protein
VPGKYHKSIAHWALQVRQAHPAPVLLECDTQTQDQFPAFEFVAQPLHEVAQSLQALYARVQELDTTAGSSISQEVCMMRFQPID